MKDTYYCDSNTPIGSQLFHELKAFLDLKYLHIIQIIAYTVKSII